MHSIVLVVAALMLDFMSGVFTQQLDPIFNMCTRFDHQSIIKNNTLYIDGGIQTFRNIDSKYQKVGKATVGYNENLIAVDLRESWDWKTNISERVIVKQKNPRTGTAPPFLSRGVLYQGTENDENIYFWGGTVSSINTSFPGWVAAQPAVYSLWSFNTRSEQWNQFDVHLDVPNRPSSASSAEAPDLGLAFYFNGEIDSGSALGSGIRAPNDKVFLEGMVILDTKNQTARNVSTKAVSGDLPRSRGRMQYVPGIGKKGILVQIGGNQKPVDDTQDRHVGDLIPMDQIDIFDIASLDNPSTPDGVWHKQKADGNIPDGRVDSCLFMAAAPDKSSYNIYLYGGRGANNTYFDDMYVLSLPSFTWTFIYKGTSPRFGHTCHQVNTRTLLTVGGIVDFNLTGSCDWEYRGVGVMDISTLTWGSVFNASLDPYQVPALVTRSIGGSPQGKATKLSPSAGFTTPSLLTLFHPPHPHPRNPKALILASLLGSLSLLSIMAAILYYHRNNDSSLFARLLHGSPPDRVLEIGDGRAVQEIMDRDVYWELDAQERHSFRGLVAGVRESVRGFMGGGAGGGGGIMGGGEKSVVAGECGKGVANITVVAELDSGKGRTALGRGGVEISVVPVGIRGNVPVPREGEWF